MNEALVDNYMD